MLVYVGHRIQARETLSVINHELQMCCSDSFRT